jgi:hypothetical protein
MFKQDRQCAYNGTLRRYCNHCYRGMQWALHKINVCICSLSYPANIAHAPYCHLWPAPIYKIFPHYLINVTSFEKKSYWVQHAWFDFLYNVCLKHFSFSEEMREIWSKMYIDFYVNYPLFLSDFNDICVFSTDNQTILKYQISRKSIQWKPSCFMRTDGQTDRHDEANSSFSQFCESFWKRNFKSVRVIERLI